jgi:hypothetical protein
MLCRKITDVHYANRAKHIHAYTPRGKCGIFWMLHLVLFLFSKTLRLTLGSTLPPTQWAFKSSFPGVKQPGCKSDYSSAYSAKLKNEWSYISTLPYAFMSHTGTSLQQVIRDIISNDKSHHSLARPFRAKAAYCTFTATLICLESGSMSFNWA